MTVDRSSTLQFLMRFFAYSAGRVAVPLVKVEEPLLMYRYHGANACRLVTEDRIRCVT